MSSSGHTATDATSIFQTRGGDVEGETPAASTLTPNSADHNRGHPEVIDQQDISASAVEGIPSSAVAEATAGVRNDPQEPDLIMSQKQASQGQGPIMTGPQTIPARLPMARQSLG